MIAHKFCLTIITYEGFGFAPFRSKKALHIHCCKRGSKVLRFRDGIALCIFFPAHPSAMRDGPRRISPCGIFGCACSLWRRRPLRQVQLLQTHSLEEGQITTCWGSFVFFPPASSSSVFIMLPVRLPTIEGQACPGTLGPLSGFTRTDRLEATTQWVSAHSH